MSFELQYKTFSCEEVICAPDKAFTLLRTHGYFEISMIVAGNGIHLVLDKAIPCKEGDIFITPPNIPHRYLLESFKDKMSIRQIRFCDDNLIGDGSMASERCYGMFSDGSITAYAMLNSLMREKAGLLFDAIETEMSEKRSSWKEAAMSNLSLLLINVARYIDSSIKNDSSISNAEWNIALSAIEIVKTSFNNPKLTLEGISDMLCVSKSRMSRIFRDVMGVNFSHYLRSVRIEEACKLLEESTIDVESVVAECGLRDLPTFYRNFQTHTGLTPSEYRRNKITSADKDIIKEKQKENKIMVLLSEISENMQKGKAKIVREMVQQALDEGANAEQILNEGLLAGMNIVGQRFKNNEIYVPEVLVAARAMNMGTELLKPYLSVSASAVKGKVCIGTVQGDLHDIGKNLVKIMMEGKGLDVIDLGTDVAPDVFIQKAIEENCQIICCSALLTTTMGVMGDVVKAAEAAGVRDKLKIMIGGAPVTEAFCKEIGADCYTPDAASAANAAAEFCRE